MLCLIFLLKETVTWELNSFIREKRNVMASCEFMTTTVDAMSLSISVRQQSFKFFGYCFWHWRKSYRNTTSWKGI